MKKKIIYGLLFVVAMVTASSSFVSCKDYEGDNYAELREQNASLRKYLDAQISAIKQCNCDLTPYLKTADLDAQVAALGYMKTADLVTNIGNNSAAIVDALSGALANAGYLKKDTLANYATKSDLDNLKNYILLGDSLKNAYMWASYSYQRLINMGDSLKTAYDQSKINKDSIKILADSIGQVALIAENNFKTAKALADSAINLANLALDSCNILDAKIADLDSAYKAADAKLQAQIDTLKDRMNVVEEKVEKLEEDVANIIGTLKKQVTGIIVQGTYSPVFGYGSLPLGVQTNILAAYAGKAVTDAQFPIKKMKDPDNNELITEGDYNLVNGLGQWPSIVTIASGDMLVDESKGNAGKMYLTVNPTNVDFEGTEFTLVNSKGEESRIQLSGLNASEEVLTFGWKRASKVDAASKNGFYEVEATIKADDAKAMQPEIRKDQFKNAVKQALNGEKRLAVKEAARAIFNSLQPIQRYGVQAEWFDDVKNDYVKYTSAYDVAAFSLNPLGFGFHVPATKYTRVPLIDINYIKEQLHISANIKTVDVEAQIAAGKSKINVVIDKSEIVLPVLTVDVPSGQVKDIYGNVIGTYDGQTITVIDGTTNGPKSYKVTVDAKTVTIDITDMYRDLYGEFNTAMGELNNVLSQVNSRIDFVVNYIEKYNYYADKVNSLIDRIGLLLQPALLWVDAQNNVGELGGVIRGNKAIGTVVSKSAKIALVPTSYTLELFAPAYKKSLIVTNAYKDGKSAQDGDATLKTAVQNLNKDLKADGFDLYSGTSLQKQFIFDASKYESGITFEIAYTAVDYEGQIAGRKCYITVGE